MGAGQARNNRARGSGHECGRREQLRSNGGVSQVCWVVFGSCTALGTGVGRGRAPAGNWTGADGGRLVVTVVQGLPGQVARSTRVAGGVVNPRATAEGAIVGARSEITQFEPEFELPKFVYAMGRIRAMMG